MKPLYLFTFVVILSISACNLFENLGKKPCAPPKGCGYYDTDKVDTSDPEKPFMKGQLVLSNTKKEGDQLVGSGVVIDTTYVKDLVQGVLDTILPDKKDAIIKVKRCICDEYIFLIEIDDIIGSENNVAEASNRPRKPSGEGWSFSLNYIVPPSIEKEGVPRFIEKNLYQEFEGNISSDDPIVAILDSGIDIQLFNDKSGLYNKGGDGNVCSIDDDKNGYNFISETPNGDVLDDNGHGTLVSLAYKYGLDKMNDNWNDQRLLPVKVLDSCGVGTIYSTVCGLAYARRKDAAVVNCSWGLDFNNFQLQRAIGEFNYRVNIVCSAGNDGELLENEPQKNHFPSGYGHSYMPVDQDDDVPDGWVLTPSKRNVFEVGALNNDFDDPCPTGSMTGLSSYSNRRPNTIGTNLYAERGNSVEFLIPETMNCCIQGTSFAAPLFSAGIISEGLDLNPYSSPTKYKMELGSESNSLNSIYSYFNAKCN